MTTDGRSENGGNESISNTSGVIVVGVDICLIGDAILGGGDAKGLSSRSVRSGMGDGDSFALLSPGVNHWLLVK